MHRSSDTHSHNVAVITSDGSTGHLLTNSLKENAIGTQLISKSDLGSTVKNFTALILDCDENLFPLRESELLELPLARVALVSPPSPAKLKWLQSLGFHGVILKPVLPEAVSSTLLCAISVFGQTQSLLAERNDLSFKLNCRKFIVLTQLRIMITLQVGEDDAYQLLRMGAMKKQVSIEDFCIRFLAAQDQSISEIKRQAFQRAC